MKNLVRRTAIAGTVGAASLVCVAGLAGPVAAAPPYQPPQVLSISGVTLTPNGARASITATYQCSGGRPGTHLWVSAKQGPDISLPDHTSSSDAQAWYDTNWNYARDPAGLTVNCDGQVRTTTFVLRPEFGQLHKGKAFVQFCLFDSTSGGSIDHGFAFSYTMQRVS